MKYDTERYASRCEIGSVFRISEDAGGGYQWRGRGLIQGEEARLTCSTYLYCLA